MHGESNSNMKYVNGRTRTKPGPILVLDYGFDYRPQNCGQISFGTETFSAHVPIFSFKTYFSISTLDSNTYSFAKCLKVYIKTMNLTNHSEL